jgi:hypothetical protein
LLAIEIKNRGMQVATRTVMQHRTISLLELAAVNAARGLAGLGFGLLIAHRLGRHQRTIVGWSLMAVGSAIVLPLGLRILMRKNHHRRADEMRSNGVGEDEPVVVA